MDRSRLLRATLIALPALCLAGLGITHPGHLTVEAAWWWSTLHVVLLPIFPLLAAAQWILLDDAPAPLRWLGRLGAFVFAVYYTGLDALAGIAGGAVVHEQGRRSTVELAVISIGDRLGEVGAWAFLVACVAIIEGAALRIGWRALPGGVLLLAASISFLDSHIFWPRGVFTMLAVAVGMFLLALVVPAGDRRTVPPPAAEPLARVP